MLVSTSVGSVAGPDRPTPAFVQPQQDGSFQVSGALDFGTQIVDNPAFAGLRAVQNNSVYPYLFADRSAGVRTAHEIEPAASLIHPTLVN